MTKGTPGDEVVNRSSIFSGLRRRSYAKQAKLRHYPLANQRFLRSVAMTANFVRLVFKTLARFFQRILPIIFQSVPFRSDRHRFSPFGINAAHFVGSSSQIFDNIIAK